ncbi:DUF4407 domain-containing protein [Nocardia sp. NPDC058705]|uniref:DUF4407 domain-containing protein n=1 Tax=Nocardia sp. NPDC058705 TaxID=3346609 RepID=UPI0036B8248B
MFSRWLLALVGVREDLLARAPSDRFRYLSMAGVLLTTAAVAAVSAAFALQMAVHAPLWAAILLGIGWGVVILNLDRLLVVGMHRHKSFRHNLYAAIPRVLLALLLGAVISTPLVLRIFESEILTEVKVQQQQKEKDYKVSIDDQYSKIQLLQTQLDGLNTKARVDLGVIANNPAVQKAQQRLDAASAEVKVKLDEETCEIAGTCGSMVEGANGPAAVAATARRVAAQQEYAAADAALKSAQEQATATAGIDATAAQAEIRRLQPELDLLVANREADMANYRKVSSNSDGLLARIEALDSLSESRPSLGRAQLMLFLLFLALEVLPVLVKLMQLNGPPTLYEKLSAEADADAEAEARREFAQASNTKGLAAERAAAAELEGALTGRASPMPPWTAPGPPASPNRVPPHASVPSGDQDTGHRPDPRVSRQMYRQPEPAADYADNTMTQPIPRPPRIRKDD